MNRFTSILLGGGALVLAAGCEGAQPVPVGATVPTTTAEALSGAVVTNIYFGIGNQLPIDAAPLAAEIRLRAGAHVDVEAATADSSLLQFSVFRARRDGTVEMVDPVYAPSGFYLGSFTASSDGLFLFLFAPHPATRVVVALDCGPGVSCTNAGEPGDTCGSARDCDGGLVCARPIGVCGAETGMGVCTVTGPSCSLQQVPVCGCDGLTYPTECAAREKGESVQTVGACAGAQPIGAP